MPFIHTFAKAMLSTQKTKSNPELTHYAHHGQTGTAFAAQLVRPGMPYALPVSHTYGIVFVSLQPDPFGGLYVM